MSREKKLSAEKKVAIVHRCLKGEYSIQEASRKAGADWKTVCEWIVRYEAKGAAGFLPYERKRIYSPELKLQAV